MPGIHNLRPPKANDGISNGERDRSNWKLQVQFLTTTLKKLLEKAVCRNKYPLKTVNKINTKNTFKAVSHNIPFKIPTQATSQ